MLQRHVRLWNTQQCCKYNHAKSHKNTHLPSESPEKSWRNGTSTEWAWSGDQILERLLEKIVHYLEFENVWNGLAMRWMVVRSPSLENHWMDVIEQRQISSWKSSFRLETRSGQERNQVQNSWSNETLTPNENQNMMKILIKCLMLANFLWLQIFFHLPRQHEIPGSICLFSMIC
jgi:hypothetical protein